MKKILSFIFGSILLTVAAHGNFFQAAVNKPSGGGGGSCVSSVLDANPASPGAWTATYSMRKLLAAYAGNGIQLQTSASGNPTLNVGFNGCDADTSTVGAFCATQTLTVGTTSSTRVAFPTGTVIHVFNEGPSGIYYAAGNGTVTATTASNALPANQGANITVGANTNIAAIIGTGFGLNGGTGSSTLFLTNCGASIVYDQSGNTNNLAQATLAKQLGYLPAGIANTQPILFGCLACNLHAADSSTYKTTTVETFSVMTFGEDTTTANFNYGGVFYPSAAASSADVARWGFNNVGTADLMTNMLNGSDVNNAEGFGGIWRGQNLTQFDYSTSTGITAWNGGTTFMTTGSGTPTYPNAVGLYVMGDPAGNGSPGMFAEALVASGNQTARNTISANQVTYWGITTGSSATTALTNPLGDGWNWNQQNLGGFAPSPPGPGAITVNGNAYFSEASWNSYTQWVATNGSTASGQKGDNIRFQITGLFDQWDGTNRSEIDGSSGGAQFAYGTEFWIAYAIYIEPGTAYNSQWNINGQMHQVEGSNVCCIFNTMSNTNSGCVDCWTVFTYNGAGTQTSNTSSFSFNRGQWYHFVYQVKPATAATGGDTFNVWLDTTTPGTMVQIASNTSATLFGGSAINSHSYWKYGLYRETDASLPTFAVRYGNMMVCSTGTDCTTKYGVSSLTALTTTPLANPAHL